MKVSLKSRKDGKEITRKEYRTLKKQGFKEAKKILKENDIAIRKDFNKAYYNKISSGELASARIKHDTNSTFIKSLMDSPDHREDWDVLIDEHNRRGSYLDEAESRRNEYLEDSRKRKKKKLNK